MKLIDGEVVESGNPGKRSFFKYTSAETALAILRTKRVRYSSPLTFNDPFDIQSGLHLELDRDSLQHKVAHRIGELAAAPEEPAVDPQNPWGQIVLAVRRHYAGHGFPIERWKERMKEPFNELFDLLDSANRDYREAWLEMLPGLRIFCVTEEWDNLLMWAHYARDHTGAVFEFLSLPENDNALSVASRVEYRESPPPFFTAEEWINDLTGIEDIDPSTLYSRYPRIKSNHWEYEKEWRVWYPDADPEKRYDDVPIHERELAAVYLGLRSSAELEREVKRLLAANFPNARLYRAEKPDGVYGLQAVPVS